MKNIFIIGLLILGILFLSACAKNKKAGGITFESGPGVQDSEGFDDPYEDVIFTHPSGKFLYLKGNKDINDPNDFHIFTIDQTTKKTTLSQSLDMETTNNLIETILVSPNGQNIYISRDQALGTTNNIGVIDVYSINQNNGSLTKIQSIELGYRSFSSQMIYRSSGHLITSDFSQNAGFKLSVYSVAGDGTLTLVKQTTTQAYYESLVMHAGNEIYFYGGSRRDDAIDVYTLNTSDYSFSLVETKTLASTVKYPHILKIASTGKYLMMMESWPGSRIYRYSIDQTTGTLSALSDFTFNLKGYHNYYPEDGSSEEFAALLAAYDSVNDYIVVNNCTFKVLSIFKVNKNNGEIQYWGSKDVLLEGAACNVAPTALKVDVTGQYLYLYQMPDSANEYLVQTYKILSSGALVLQ